MKVSYKIMVVWWTVILALIACSFIPANLTQSPVTPETQFQLPAYTPSPECVPPCFYGIVPGQTTITGTLSLLKATPEQVSDHTLLSWSTKTSVRWNHILFEQGIVKAIVLYEPTGTTLGQLVEEHGVPKQVIVGRPGAEVSGEDFILVYPTQGVAYLSTKQEIESPSRADGYVPTSDMMVLGTIYFEPNLNEHLKQYSWTIDMVTAAHASPWLGFGQSYYAP